MTEQELVQRISSHVMHEIEAQQELDNDFHCYILHVDTFRESLKQYFHATWGVAAMDSQIMDSPERVTASLSPGRPRSTG
ncbi:hypothetical protein AB0L06_04695 [Spirillospora sp. NPDC052269]